jgi:pimeloyl-ACP methyl ester carboxylesterase
MSTTAPFTLQTPSGQPLHGLVDLPDGPPSPRPTVVICHGFKGFMEWGFFPHLATLLAERGFVAVRFNVSGTGQQPGDDLVTDPAAFEANTPCRELADTLAVLEALGETVAPGWVDLHKIGLVGHSRGGGNAVLAASRAPWCDRVRALVTWASVATFDRFSPEQKEQWRRDGRFPVVNARTGQQLALGPGFLDDLERRGAEIDILAAAGRVRAPWLVIHGVADESVPSEEANRLAGAAGGPKEILLLEDANHTFGARHPFAGPTPHLIRALNATQTWFRRYL